MGHRPSTGRSWSRGGFVTSGHYRGFVILAATIRQKPAPHAKNVDGLDTRSIIAEGDDYNAAKAGLAEQMPDGWQMLYVRES